MLQEPLARAGRLIFPLPLFAYPFYLWQRSPGKEGSHYDPECDLFKPSEKGMVQTSNAFMLGMLAVLGVCAFKFGPLAVFNLYVVPYWINVVWLDIVTYLHHHGSSDKNEQMPWYRCARTPLTCFSLLRGRAVCCAVHCPLCLHMCQLDILP